MARSPLCAMRSCSTKSAKSAKPEQPRLFAAQFQNARRSAGGCRAPARSRALRKRAIHLLANRAVVQIGHHRDVAGRLQGKAPALHASSTSALCRAASIALGGRPASFASSVITSSNALVESRTFSENFVVSFVSSTSISASRFLPRRSSSAPWRRNESSVFVRKRSFGSAQQLRLRRCRIRLQLVPQPLVQRNLRIECAGFGLHRIPCGAQFRACMPRIPDAAPRPARNPDSPWPFPAPASCCRRSRGESSAAIASI